MSDTKTVEKLLAGLSVFKPDAPIMICNHHGELREFCLRVVITTAGENVIALKEIY